MGREGAEERLSEEAAPLLLGGEDEAVQDERIREIDAQGDGAADALLPEAVAGAKDEAIERRVGDTEGEAQLSDGEPLLRVLGEEEEERTDEVIHYWILLSIIDI